MLLGWCIAAQCQFSVHLLLQQWDFIVVFIVCYCCMYPAAAAAAGPTHCDGDWLLSRTISELVATNQSISSRLQQSLDRLAGVDAENKALKSTTLMTSQPPVHAQTRCCQHRGHTVSNVSLID